MQEEYRRRLMAIRGGVDSSWHLHKLSDSVKELIDLLHEESLLQEERNMDHLREMHSRREKIY